MRVLAIAPHPDDETLGCGGTLLRHRAEGDELHWLLVTDASGPLWDDGYRQLQREQVEAVEAAFPFASLTWLRQPSTRLDALPMADLVEAIRDVIVAVRPDTVYVPNRSDAHSDHRVVFRAATAALKSFYLGGLGVRRVLAFESPSETDAAPALAEDAFVPNVFVDVSSTLERKLELFQLYASEVHPGHGPRSLSAVRAIARHRGAAVNVEYAEAFMLLMERA
jgi:LmbE family N-acetylglucosaminyl deacetylase